ncbi:MAG: LysR family transcriptional regulator [Lautropia sp.]
MSISIEYRSGRGAIMELRHLRYFLAVAEAGNLTQAARKLHIAQPPLSVQIRQLEDELGVPLFVRHPKGVRLTAAGEALLPAARDALDRVLRLREIVAGKAGGPGFALGYVPSAGGTVLPGLLRRLRAARPGIVLQLREMISSEQVEALAAGGLDAGLLRLLPRDPRLMVAARLADPFCLALPHGGPTVSAAAVDLRAFADHPFVAFTRHRGPAYFDQAIHLCARAGFSPRIDHEASTLHGLLDLVAAGLGAALVPRSARLLARRGVRFQAIRGRQPDQVLALVQRRPAAGPLDDVARQAAAVVFAQMSQAVSAAGGETKSGYTAPSLRAHS